MTKLAISVLLATFTLLSACAEKDPAAMSKEVDEMLAKDYPMTEEQQDQITALTAQARELLAQGKAEDSIKAYDQALAVLKEVEDAAIFNKAD